MTRCERWNKRTTGRYWRERGKGYWEEMQDSRAQNWKLDSTFLTQEATLRHLLQELPYETFLDVGCGYGRITALAKGEGVGLDLSEDELQAAVSFHPTQTIWIQGDGEHLPFPDGSFDLVMATEFLMHLPPLNARRALTGMIRVSRRFVFNLDWSEVWRLRRHRRHNWVHDYETWYADLGLSVKQIRLHRQTLFLMDLESEQVVDA